MFVGKPAASPEGRARDLRLESGSRVGVLGSGPAGSFFSYFVLAMARRTAIDLQVDIYEPRDFSLPAPAGCNMCGGIVSESLVQLLAVEGINLPPTVVQRGIDSYVLHMDEGSIGIETPHHEKRIAVVHRGAGPRGIKQVRWNGLDGYLQQLALAQGARVIRGRVDGVSWADGRPQITPRGALPQTYDLLAVALGVNTGTLKLFQDLGFGYKPPRTTRTYICELGLGQKVVEEYLGNSMHIFLLNIPRLEFGALIPKGDSVTMCLLGQEIDAPLAKSFLNAPEVRQCFPPGWQVPSDLCHCSPRINIHGAVQPFADRVVFVGDCGVTKLYKDGIGSAYHTAKAAAATAVLEGIAAEHFRRHYWPVCQAIARDNQIGKALFAATHRLQKAAFARRGLLSMVAREQEEAGGRRPMSMVLWDIFTGSALYRDACRRMLHPACLGRLLWQTAVGSWPHRQVSGSARAPASGGLSITPEVPG